MLHRLLYLPVRVDAPRKLRSTESHRKHKHHKHGKTWSGSIDGFRKSESECREKGKKRQAKPRIPSMVVTVPAIKTPTAAKPAKGGTFNLQISLSRRSRSTPTLVYPLSSIKLASSHYPFFPSKAYGIEALYDYGRKLSYFNRNSHNST